MAMRAWSNDQEYDRLAEVREFDSSKRGVKGLVDSGITSIPRCFIHPQEILKDLQPKVSNTDDVIIPTIDFSGLASGNQRTVVVEQVANACRDFGLFQVTNHGIPEEVLDNIVEAIRAFHEQPPELKAPIYRREGGDVSYHSNKDLFRSKAASWRDTLQIMPGQSQHLPEETPELCRNEIVNWHQQTKRVGQLLMTLFCEGLGLNRSAWNDKAEVWAILGHYYPHCPEPHLTFWNAPHTDAVVFTILVQDHSGGLQANYHGEWVNVTPVPGAIVVNVGDLLQILSNDAYKSVEHRVLASSSRQARVSIVSFFKPCNEDCSYGPFPELISQERPAQYRQFRFSDFTTRFFAKDFGKSKSLLEHYKI